MKIALITDTHAGARGESEAFNDFFFKFWEGVFFPYIEKHNIKQVIHLGDAYDRQKYVTYTIANSWRTRFWDRLRSVKVDCLVGNHDAPNNRHSNTPNAFDELCQQYVNVRVFSECTLQHYDGIPIALIPWINKGNHGITMEFIDKVKASLAMGHLELKGFEMDKGNVSKFGMERDLFKKFEMVMSGHYHHRSTDGHIWYLGNTYEITWADYQDPRGFHIFDTHTRDLEFIKNPHRMFYKLGYHGEEGVDLSDLSQDDIGELKDKIVRIEVTNRDNDKAYKKFLEDVHEEQPYKIEVDDQSMVIDKPEIEVKDVKNTLAVIHDYISNSDIPPQEQDQLKDLMKDLYREAHGSF